VKHKYSVGWHGLLFPSIRGMGGEQKFLLFVCLVCVCVCAPSPCAFQRLDKKKFLVKDILVSLDLRSPSDGQMSFDNISLTLVLL